MHSSDKDSLLLPNLAINGFRGIKSLRIPKLGRVTLLTGKNGVGKTTVLEAARIWSARGSGKSLKQLLLGRDEISASQDGRINEPDGSFVSTLFWGRDPKIGEEISIGPERTDGSNTLRFEFSGNHESYPAAFEGQNLLYSDVSILVRSFNNTRTRLVWTPDPIQLDISVNETIDELSYNSLGMGSLSRQTMLSFWDNVVLTPDERPAVEALNHAIKGDIDQIAAIGKNNSRRLMAKSKIYNAPIPVKDLGDGANKMLWLTLAMASSQNGFLFIDEAENGIHYTVHKDFWGIVMQEAQKKNVQVIATTHSFDCVKGFARAAIENGAVEGMLVRVEQNYGEFKVVTFDESEVEVVARKNIEVR